MNKLIDFFTKRGVFSDLITLFVIVGGLFFFGKIKRETFPNITFDFITISTIFPGSSSEESEKLITNPLERDLKEVDGVKTMASQSVEGRSYITLQLDPDQVEIKDAKEDVKDVIDKFILPEGAEDSIVNIPQSKLNPIIEISLSGELEEMKLRDLAKMWENEIESIPGVARIVVRGERDLEIRVEADMKKLNDNQISLDQLIVALKNQNNNIPAGSIESDPTIENRERLIKTIGEFKDIPDVENAVVRANVSGNVIRVKDVAKVFYELEKSEIRNRTNGRLSLGLTVLKQEAADIITVTEAVKAKVDEIKKTLPAEVKVDLINDQSMYVERRLDVLNGNLILGLALVLIILSLILPWRVALMVSMGIPFSYLGMIIIFYYTGVSINLLSMIGMIIVSGMLVDDAIVVTDNCMRYIDMGMSPREAAVKGTQEIWAPVAASVLTTVLAFAPLLSMSGIFGKFVKFIPLAVIYCLIISLLEAYFILPYHISRYIKKREAISEESHKKANFIQRFLNYTSRLWDEKIAPGYSNFITYIIPKRYLMLGVFFVLFVGSLGLAKAKLNFVLFPADGVEIFFIRAQAPVGTNIATMSEMIKPIEEEVSKLSKTELDMFTSTVGLVQQDPNDPFTKRGSQYAQIAIYLTPEEKRTRDATKIIDYLREKLGERKEFVSLTFDRVRTGPPVGKAINIGVQGPEYEQIRQAVERLKTFINEKVVGASDVSDSFAEGKKEYLLKLKQQEMATVGLNSILIGTAVRSAFEGIVATSIQRIDEQVDIRVTLPHNDKNDLNTLKSLLISNNRGNLVRLEVVANIEEGQGIASYEHESNRRQVRVSGDLDNKVNDSLKANELIRKEVENIKKDLPMLQFDFGGEEKDTNESLESLKYAFMVALLLIYLVLVFTFQNVHQPFLILFTIPMGIVAVLVTFVIHDTFIFVDKMPLSFMAMMGIVALAGVIVNNAIVFVDFTNSLRKEGQDRFSSIINASKVRIRPIFLTTVTTVLGLLPTAYGIGGKDPFVVPIAMSLGWGLFFGSILTAIFMPVGIAIFDDLEKPLRKYFPVLFHEDV